MINKPPIDIHEAGVERHAGRDPDAIIEALSRGGRVAREHATRLHQAAEALAADGSQSDDAKRLRLREAALAVGARAAAELDRSRQIAATEIARLEAETGRPPAGDPMIESEIRATLRHMTREDRRKALADPLVLGAALRGPALLAGMSTTEQEADRETYRRRAHPEVAARIERLRSATEAFDRVGKSFTGYIARAAAVGELQARQSEHAAAALAAVKGDA